MSRRSWGAVIRKALIVALVYPLFSARAQAEGAVSAGNLTSLWRLAQRIEKVQYFTLGDNDYCWYSDGWNGAGWYECGDQSIYGFGWGGAYGWNGWGGGERVQPNRYHRVGVYHPGRPPIVADPLRDPIEGADLESSSSYERLPNPSSVPVRPDLTEDAAPDRARPKTPLEARRPFGHEDLPRYNDFAGRPGLLDETALPFQGLSNNPAPVFHGFGGGEGLQDFGFHNSSGFHGPSIHAGAGIRGVGGFAGFHPIGGAMLGGGHIGGIGHR